MCWKRENRTNNSNFRNSFYLLLPLEEILNRNFLYFQLDSLLFWLDRFLFLVILTFPESFLLFWLCWSLILRGEGEGGGCWMCARVPFSELSVSSDALTVPWWRLDNVAECPNLDFFSPEEFPLKKFSLVVFSFFPLIWRSKISH